MKYSRIQMRPLRNERGIQLIELLVALVIGAILMAATFTECTGMYRASSSGENQVLATNMAQQVIDNARNSKYDHLRDNILGGAGSVTQEIPLFDYPVDPSKAVFPRPLLRNEDLGSGMTYSDQSLRKTFNGTVTERLTNLTPGNMTNGMIRVDVNVNWTDSRGPHSYTTGTIISQLGIHN